MIRLFISFYLVLVSCVMLYVFSEGVIRTHLIHDMLVSDSIDDYSSGFYLLDQLHQVLDPSEFSSLVDNLPEDTNLPMTLHSIDTLDFSASNLAMLNRGDIYVADTEVDILYKRLGSSDLAAQFGPVSTHSPLLTARNIYQFSLFVVLALPVIYMVLSMQRKISRLEDVTAHFGNGSWHLRFIIPTHNHRRIVRQEFAWRFEKASLAKGHHDEKRRRTQVDN